MKRFKNAIIGFLVFIVQIAFIAIGYGANYLYNLALNPKTPKGLIFTSHDKSSDSGEQSQTSGVIIIDDQTWLLEQSNYEDLFITSRDGLCLHNYVLNIPNSNKWVITVHGYTSEGLSMASYARIFYNMGYNIMIPDLRGHGQRKGIILEWVGISVLIYLILLNLL